MAEKDKRIQGMTLLHVLGADAIEVYSTFVWGDNDVSKVSDIKKKNEILQLMKNIIDERHGFNTRSQKEGKSTDVFVMELK